jgi:hypothetical protein
MMNRHGRLAIALVCALWSVQGRPVQAQWHYPGGFDPFGWMGWEFGVESTHGSIARGMGALAEGLGFYNKATAIAESINTDTVMRWNQYVHEAQMNANRLRRLRIAGEQERNQKLNDIRQNRLRNNPEQRDVFQGDALNVALDEINDPRVYAKALEGSKIKIGGDRIRHIPFRYNAAAITMSIHQLQTGALPAVLQRPEFDADRAALKALDEQIMKETQDDMSPDPATVKKLLGAIYAAEEKAASILPENTLERKQAERYLKSLHGLVAMLKAPALDGLLAGVEKRPDATLGQLLSFMNAFNLRFGVAGTPQQREVYSYLYPQLVQLRDQVAPALAAAAVPQTSADDAENFFSAMNLNDLKKEAPRP